MNAAQTVIAIAGLSWLSGFIIALVLERIGNDKD